MSEEELLSPAAAAYLAVMADRWTLVPRALEPHAVAAAERGFAKVKRERFVTGVSGSFYRYFAKRTHEGRAAVGLPALN